VREITNSAGNSVNTYKYDSYGRFEARIEGVTQPYTFTAREFDSESGLYFYRARYYNPEIGRFTSEDPIGFSSRDFNLYRYAFNSPENLIDPLGNVALIGYVRNSYVRGVSALSKSKAFRLIMRWQNPVKRGGGNRLQPYNPKNGCYLSFGANVGWGPTFYCVADVGSQLVFGYQAATEGKPLPIQPGSPAAKLASRIGFLVGMIKNFASGLATLFSGGGGFGF